MKHSEEERRPEDSRIKKRMHRSIIQQIRKKYTEAIILLFVLQVKLRERRGFVVTAVGCVIYVSTAWGTGPSNESRTMAIWDSRKFLDDNIKRKLFTKEKLFTVKCYLFCDPVFVVYGNKHTEQNKNKQNKLEKNKYIHTNQGTSILWWNVAT